MNKNFFSNWIVRNIIGAAAVILILTLCAKGVLSCVTRHGSTMSVPDFTGMTIKQAGKAARQSDLRTIVVDSIYVRNMPRGTVVKQNPAPGNSVKEGRSIHLTINAMTPKQIPMPSLVGYSLRSAAAELSSRGLLIGRLNYVNDMATNNVLRQLYDGREIDAGEMLPAESKVDLVLGLSEEDGITSVPSLTGSNYNAAIDRIHLSSLNVGRVVFDRGIRSYKDSLAAVVYRQSPEPGPCDVGRNVTIFLTLDADKLPSGNTAE